MLLPALPPQRRRNDLVLLEVGCHSGAITRDLAADFRLAIGIEYEWRPLQVADPATRLTVQLVRADAMRLPIRDASVDVVVCAQVYEHVPDDRLLISELRRVLAPGGVVFFSGPNWLWPIEMHYRLPCLHWLPQRLADRWLQRIGGSQYYERSRTWWGLRWQLRRFAVRDASPDVAARTLDTVTAPWGRWLRRLPRWTWITIGWALPNFNWILTRRS